VFVGEARDLGDAFAGRLPLDAHAAGQLMAKVGLVDVAGGFGVFVDRGVVKARPAAVWTEGRVGDQDMGMELRVAGAGRAMGVGGGKEAVAGDEFMTAFAPAGPAGLTLQVAERFGHGGAVGVGDLAGNRMAAERPGERDRLRSREGEVEAGNRLAVRCRLQPERFAANRVVAGQHRDELVGVDLALQAEVGGGVAEPVALCLALAGVIVLGSFGDLVEIISLHARAEEGIRLFWSPRIHRQKRGGVASG